MDVHTNIPLKNYTTMRIGGNARFIVEARTPDDIVDIATRANQQHLPLFILGSGSNTLAGDALFDGIVVLNRIMGISVIADTASDTTFRVGAGENWDHFVEQTVNMGLSGIEALSAIPGTVGASPVQNIGAYGQEVAETIIGVDAYDLETNQFASLTNEECQFSYRNSIFRGSEMGRYVIMNVTFRLYKTAPKPPFYAALQTYLDVHNITIVTPAVIRSSIAAIRAEKLPDPSILPNSGSFFKNAIVEKWLYKDLLTNYPDMPSYEMPHHKYKIPAGWLIEQAGLKGKIFNGIRVYEKNALVLVNESASSYADLAAARDTVTGTVRDMFRINLIQEPLEISTLAKHT